MGLILQNREHFKIGENALPGFSMMFPKALSALLKQRNELKQENHLKRQII